MVYNLALRLTRDRTEAAVVLQETFLKIFSSLARFQSRSSLKTWIYRIAVNESLQRLRRRRASRTVGLERLEEDPRRDLRHAARLLQNDPHRLLERRELRAKLADAIGRLPPRHRTAFVLVDMEGLPAKEAARLAGIPVPALKTNLRRARLFLRDELADYLERSA